MEATVLPSCSNEEKESTGIRCIGPQKQVLPSGTRWRTAVASSSTAAAAAAVQQNTEKQQQEKYMAGINKNIRVYSYVVYYDLSDPGILSCETTHTIMPNKKRYKKIGTPPPQKKEALRQSNPRPRALSECKLLFNHPSLSYMVRVYIRLIYCPRQSRERQARWGTSSKHHREWRTLSRAT